MTDHKYTDEEVIKGLECCSTYSCDGCPYRKFATDCVILLPQNALDLVERQKAEIERLTEEINSLNGNTEKYIAECEKRSREVAEDYRKEIKTEAIKEFAERLKESAFECDVSFGYGREHYTEAVAVVEIDTLVKEMTEGHDESQNT